MFHYSLIFSRVGWKGQAEAVADGSITGACVDFTISNVVHLKNIYDIEIYMRPHV